MTPLALLKRVLSAVERIKPVPVEVLHKVEDDLGPGVGVVVGHGEQWPSDGGDRRPDLSDLTAAAPIGQTDVEERYQVGGWTAECVKPDLANDKGDRLRIGPWQFTITRFGVSRKK